MIRVLTKLAWRDLRGSRWKAGLIVAALSMSVAAVHGVRGAELAARHALEADLRSWLGADVAATTGESLDAEVLGAVDGVSAQGVVWTWVTWSLAMSRSAESPDAVPTVVKVVDPQVYPLYPGIELEPAQTLASALSGDRIVVSPEVLEKAFKPFYSTRSGGTGSHPVRPHTIQNLRSPLSGVALSRK